MRYQELMQSLEQELRAVLLIQKQDNSALKSCTAEQKDSLRLAQKLLKAYKSGLPIQEFWGLLLGDKEPFNSEQTLHGGIEELYKKLSFLLELEDSFFARDAYKEPTHINHARKVLDLEEEDLTSYKEAFKELSKKEKKYYKALNECKYLGANSFKKLKKHAALLLKRAEEIPDWLDLVDKIVQVLSVPLEEGTLFRYIMNPKAPRFHNFSEEGDKQIQDLLQELQNYDIKALYEQYDSFQLGKDGEETLNSKAQSFLKYRTALIQGMLAVPPSANKEQILGDIRSNPVLPEEYEYKKFEGIELFSNHKRVPDKEDIDINDISQGRLGNCYALGALGAIAQSNPQLIRDAIREEPGGYSVRLYLPPNNKETRVFVDNQFPVTNAGSNQPIYAKLGDNELWVMVFEKALAKVAGSYQGLKGGRAHHILEYLTGQESEEKLVEGTETEWEEAIKLLGENKALIFGTKKTISGYNLVGKSPNDGVSIYDVNGRFSYLICAKHAYTALSYNEETETIRLRNPHGGQNSAINDLIGKLGNPHRGYEYISMTKEEFFQLVGTMHYSK